MGQEMTAKRINRGKNHSYELDGRPVTGVTTILNKGVPKPALINWAANTVAGYAIDHWDELAEMTPSARFTEIKKAHITQRDAAAVRGTEVHGLAEKLGRGEEIEVPEYLAGHVEACVRFLDDWQVQPILQEVAVFSRKHQYAGTLDMIAKLANGQTALIDYKTNKSGPFGEVALQLAAYRYADFYIDAEGNEAPLPKVDECYVAWIRSDGYSLVPFTAGPEVFRSFLYVQQVANFADTSRDLRGPDINSPFVAHIIPEAA